MALKKCKECGAEISSSAEVCPSCGKKLKKKHPILGGFLIVIGLCGIIGSISGGNPTPSTTNTVSTSVVITRENYDKIENGMTMEEVNAILGEPSMTSENEIAGITTVLHHYQLPLTTTAIDVYFTNGKVSAKNYAEI